MDVYPIPQLPKTELTWIGLAKSLYTLPSDAKPSKQIEQAAKALQVANPHIERAADLKPGVIVNVPDLPGLVKQPVESTSACLWLDEMVADLEGLAREIRQAAAERSIQYQSYADTLHYSNLPNEAFATTVGFASKSSAAEAVLKQQNQTGAQADQDLKALAQLKEHLSALKRCCV